MWIKNGQDIDIHVLPDAAKCKVTGMSPLEMDCCPLHEFDDQEECWPCMCEQYTEDPAGIIGYSPTLKKT